MKCENCFEDITDTNHSVCECCGCILGLCCQSQSEMCDDCEIEQEKFRKCEGKGF
jgi:hypothetical protein